MGAVFFHGILGGAHWPNRSATHSIKNRVIEPQTMPAVATHFQSQFFLEQIPRTMASNSGSRSIKLNSEKTPITREATAIKFAFHDFGRMIVPDPSQLGQR